MNIATKLLFFSCALGLIGQDCFGHYNDHGVSNYDSSSSSSSSSLSSYDSESRRIQGRKNIGLAAGGAVGGLCALLVADKVIKKLGITDEIVKNGTDSSMLENQSKADLIISQAHQELAQLLGQDVSDRVQIKILNTLPKKSTSLSEWLRAHKIVLSKATLALAAALCGSYLGAKISQQGAGRSNDDDEDDEN